MAPISKDECILCGHWPEKDRWAFRDAIEILPLDNDGVCDACFATFWQKCAADDPEPKGQAYCAQRRICRRTAQRRWGVLCAAELGRYGA
jgi:hypothetical protein